MKIKNKFLARASVAAALAVPSFAAFAEGENTPTDTTKITEQVKAVGKAAKEGLEAAVSAATPYLTGVLIAVIGIYIVPLVWRWIKRIFGRG